jgi:hypothetical protein
MEVAIGLILILGGLIYVTNWIGVSHLIYSRMQERWASLGDGLIRKCARVYFILGAVPFWAFRTFCFVFMVCGGAVVLAYGLR